MNIRQAKPADAGQLLELIADAENSNFMLYEPGERQLGVDQFERKITAMQESGKSTIFLAESADGLVGYLFVIGGERNRTQHSVYLVIGIRETSRGQGVGAKLFEQMEHWAKEQKIHRLELTVMIHNRAGLALYHRMGFKIEGIKKNSLKVDGHYIDEYYMAKLMK